MPDLDELTDMPNLIPTLLFPSNIHQSGNSMRLFFTFTFIVMIMMIMMVIMMIVMMMVMMMIVMVLMKVLAVTMIVKMVILVMKILYDKNNNNDDDGDYDDNDDDVGVDSRPPQLFLALSDTLLFMI